MMVTMRKRAGCAENYPENSLELAGTGRNEPVICRNKEKKPYYGEKQAQRSLLYGKNKQKRAC